MYSLRKLPLHFFLALIFLFAGSAFTAETPYISVGSARIKKMVLAFPEIRTQESRPLAKSVAETVINDLTFMDLFTFQKPNAFIEDTNKAGLIPGTFRYSDWKSIGTDFLIKSSISEDADKNLVFEAHLYDIANDKEILAKRYLAPISQQKTAAHTFANDVVQVLTGQPGIFLTKIAMSCDMTGKKEIYIMNFDGTEVKQVTRHRSIAFAPAWNADVSRLSYSLFTRKNNVKNIDLYEFNFTTNTIRQLSGRKGINSGASYSPDGKKIALTMSFAGNPEIYTMDTSGNSVMKMTKSFGFDVDPAWSPDSMNIAFVSSRTGMPMVFTMKADGSGIQRLTFAGRYNASPTWSPRNDKIGFAGWIDKSFDIFIMNPDGTHIERLTKNQGNNEDPHFSPDGNFIVFSSNRAGQKNVYAMNVDGTFVKRLTYGLGNCVAPKWSSIPTAGVSNIQH